MKTINLCVCVRCCVNDLILFLIFAQRYTYTRQLNPEKKNFNGNKQQKKRLKTSFTRMEESVRRREKRLTSSASLVDLSLFFFLIIFFHSIFFFNRKKNPASQHRPKKKKQKTDPKDLFFFLDNTTSNNINVSEKNAGCWKSILWKTNEISWICTQQHPISLMHSTSNWQKKKRAKKNEQRKIIYQCKIVLLRSRIESTWPLHFLSCSFASTQKEKA